MLIGIEEAKIRRKVEVPNAVIYAVAKATTHKDSARCLGPNPRFMTDMTPN
jgi:hypothetical protein